MNTKQLRQKILDLAIRGKLVPQDPNDEPASVLLERIRAEKERLIREGKIKRDKKDHKRDKSNYGNVPFELPAGWVWCRLGDIARVGTGATPLTSNPQYYSSGTIPWVTSKETSNEYIDNPTAYITQTALDETNCSLYPVGTLIVAMYGEGKTRGQISELKIEAATNQACATICLFRQDTVVVNYIKSCFMKYYDDLRNQAKGAQQPNLNLGIILDFVLPLPPLPEQHRIVAAINAAFAVIDEIERNKTDLQVAIAAAKQKILSLAIQGKLVPQDPDDEPASALLERMKVKSSVDSSHYPKLPEGWAVCPLSTIGRIIGGGTPRTDEPAYWENGSIPWITPADLSGYAEKFISSGNRMITPKGLSESSTQLLPKGSVLFSSRAPIGYTVIAANEVCTNQGFKSVAPYVEGVSDYLYYHLRAQIEEIRTRASGTTFKEISGTEMGKTIVLLPPLTEQSRIVNMIEKSFEWLNMITDCLN